MRRALFTLLLAMAACEGGTEPVYLIGTWSYDAALTTSGTQCSTRGVLIIEPAPGHGVAGTATITEGTCDGTLGVDLGPFPVEGEIGGAIDERRFLFSVPPCMGHGGLVSLGLMEGTTNCLLTIEGEYITLDGTWTAARLD